MDKDLIQINEIVAKFFSSFTNKDNKIPEVSALYKICINEILIIYRTDKHYTSYTLDSFTSSRWKILTEGALTEFEEYEIIHETNIGTNIAHRYSHYQKSGIQAGDFFNQKGYKLFQFIKIEDEWRISSIIWENEIRALH